MSSENKIKTIEDLIAWKKAMELCYFIYPLTNEKKFENDFDLRRQVRKSCISPAFNIAEGFGRRGNREFVNFLSIALGSLCELDTQLRIALKFSFITQDEFQTATNLISDCTNLCGGLINYLNNSNQRGAKYGNLKEGETEYQALSDFIPTTNSHS